MYQSSHRATDWHPNILSQQVSLPQAAPTVILETVDLLTRLKLTTSVVSAHDDGLKAWLWFTQDGAKRFHLEPSKIAMGGTSAGKILHYRHAAELMYLGDLGLTW